MSPAHFKEVADVVMTAVRTCAGSRPDLRTVSTSYGRSRRARERRRPARGIQRCRIRGDNPRSISRRIAADLNSPGRDNVVTMITAAHSSSCGSTPPPARSARPTNHLSRWVGRLPVHSISLIDPMPLSVCYVRERAIRVTTETDSYVRRIALSCRRRGFVIRPTKASHDDRSRHTRNPQR